MSEDPAERTRQYLAVVEKALREIETIASSDALRIIDYAKRYTADSKYYLEACRPTTALASVAYAEGLLDSLGILGIIPFADTTESNQSPATNPPPANDISTMRP